jgi:hypothetical protein
VCQYALSYADNVFRAFVLAKYDFGKPAAQLSMVIDAGIAEVFKRQSRKLLQSFVRLCLTGFYFLQQLSHLVLVHFKGILSRFQQRT